MADTKNMDKLPVPDNEIVPLDAIAQDVKGLRILFVNLFSVGPAGGPWILVDAGLSLSASRIRHWAEDIHGKGSRPEAIVLTHGHFDHVGALRDLVEEWDVPVYATEGELPYITGRAEYPPPDPSVGGGLMAVLSPLFPRGPVDVGNRASALPDDGTVPGLPDWKWLATPGHTPGHVSFFRERDRLLLVGDAFCSVKAESLLAIAQQKPELHGPPAYYTPDWDAARESVRRLADLRPEIVAFGHGLPMAGPEVPHQLRQLAVDFDRIALPDQGRYVQK